MADKAKPVRRKFKFISSILVRMPARCAPNSGSTFFRRKTKVVAARKNRPRRNRRNRETELTKPGGATYPRPVRQTFA